MGLRGVLTAVLAAALLTGCSLPRGAALQSEITSPSRAEEAGIAVHPVTRAFLPVVAHWPVAQTAGYAGWPHDRAGAADPVIRPLDTLSIVIWDNAPNSLLTNDTQRLVNLPETTVTAGGTVFLPYVGEVRVADRTEAAARRQLQREMEAIVPSAQVQLTRTGGARSSVSVISGVAQPGLYPVRDGTTTVLTILSEAGGPVDLRHPFVRLTRGGRTYATPLQRLYESSSADISVHGGDKISLAADPRYFRALGAAGTEALLDFDRAEITALDAVSMMGGLSDARADPKGVLILREYPDRALRSDGQGPGRNRVVFTIDLTTSDGLFSAGRFQIQHKDTVLVTESPVTSVQTVFGLVGRAFGLVEIASN